MRFEIIIPDNTRPELKERITALALRISEQPELAEQLLFEDEEDAGIQVKFTEEVLQSLKRDEAEMDAGKFFVNEQVSEYLVQKQEAWSRENTR